MQPNEARGEILISINGSAARAYLVGLSCTCAIGSVSTRGDGNAVITGVSAATAIGKIGGRLTKTGFQRQTT